MRRIRPVFRRDLEDPHPGQLPGEADSLLQGLFNVRLLGGNVTLEMVGNADPHHPTVQGPGTEFLQGGMTVVGLDAVDMAVKEIEFHSVPLPKEKSPQADDGLEIEIRHLQSQGTGAMGTL